LTGYPHLLQPSPAQAACFRLPVPVLVMNTDVITATSTRILISSPSPPTQEIFNDMGGAAVAYTNVLKVLAHSWASRRIRAAHPVQLRPWWLPCALLVASQRHLLASFAASIAARICAVLGRTLMSGSECAQRTTPVRSMRKSDGIAISWCVLPEWLSRSTPKPFIFASVWSPTLLTTWNASIIVASLSLSTGNGMAYVALVFAAASGLSTLTVTGMTPRFWYSGNAVASAWFSELQ